MNTVNAAAWRTRAADIVYPLITLVVGLALWSLSIRWFSVPNYILPTPTAVYDAVWVGYVEGKYWGHVAFTLQNIIVG